MSLNEPKKYEEICEENAGQIYYYDVDGIPVKEVYSEDGTYSDRYGWKGEKWVLGYPSDDKFMDEGEKITTEQFKDWTKNTFGFELK